MGELPLEHPLSRRDATMKTYAEVASFIRQNEVGRRASIETPFGRRLLCYADLTATGRYLHFVEAWIRRVRPVLREHATPRSPRPAAS